MSTEILTGRGESGKEFLFAFVSKVANVTSENVKIGTLPNIPETHPLRTSNQYIFIRFIITVSRP